MNRFLRPVIKGCMPVYRLSESVFRIGAQLGVTSQFTDPKGQMWTLIQVLDGRSLNEIVAAVVTDHPELTENDVISALQILDESGFLDEQVDVNEIKPRFRSNFEYFVAHPGNNSISARKACKQLQNSHVVLLGLGGGGANIATLLSGVGLGKLTVVDYDRVEESNLGRQYLYRSNDVGRLKVEVAEEALAQMNPYMNVIGINKKSNLVQMFPTL